MKFHLGTLAAAIPLACFTLAAPALARDTCTGYSAGMGTSRVLIHDRKNLPMHLASGECGPVSTNESGQSTSRCLYTDADQDQWTSEQTWTGNGDEGKWCNRTGTGKYEKTMGGCGWWKIAQTGAVQVWTFGGECMPAKKAKAKP